MLGKLIGYASSLGAGLALKAYLLPHLFGSGWAVGAKLSDRAELCSWERAFTYYSRLDSFDRVYRAMQSKVRVADYDPGFEIELVARPGLRSLWLPRDAGGPGAAWRLSEQDWMEAHNAEDHVQPGDIVVEAGAGPGVFVAKALQRGASKVLAFEPDPRMLECLRRNFRPEIDFGRVVIAPLEAGSGPESIDRMTTDLRLARVHFLRVAGGGNALAGAIGILGRDRPRVMVDWAAWPGGTAEVPRILNAAYGGYHPSCGPCRGDSPDASVIVPHVVFFR